MAYNGQYNGNRNRFGFSPYNQPSRGFGGYSNYNQPPRGGFQNVGFAGGGKPKKKSGCTKGIGKNSRPYVRGWKADRTHGMRSFIASPGKNSHVTTSGNGRQWENWTLKVTTQWGVDLYNCLYDVRDEKVICSDLSIVMNPKTNYVGPYFRRKNKG